ncbi:MAG: hypothetical protein PHW95_01495 [Patescibacteria group bacterium]|nr:hypothetical protein [Patescibacteria group bacterium]
MKKDRFNEVKNKINQNNQSVQKGLLKIYSNSDGSLPDISHLEINRQPKWKLLLFLSTALILIASATAWAGFIFFNSNGALGNNHSVRLDITSQQSIASGDEVDYVISYKNIDKVNLNNVEIIVRYPDGFTFTSADPAPSNEFNTSWKIGILSKDQAGRIEIKGKIIGEVGSIKTISVTASFTPENFSSTFKEDQSYSSQITSSILAINIDGPTQALPEKKVTYKIQYQNNSDQDLNNIKIEVDYPANFIYQDSVPKPYSRPDDARNLNNQWVIDSLGKGEQGEIDITGGYVADDNITAANFTARIGFFDPKSDQLSIQQDKTVVTQLISPNLSLNLIVNGSNTDQPISFGSTLHYSLVYKNMGQKDLNGVSFTVTLDSDILDWSSLDDKHNGVVKGNQITWGKDQISELDVVRALSEGTIDFAINVKDPDKINTNRDRLQVTSSAQADITNIADLPDQPLTVKSPEIKNNITTDLQLKVQGRYFDDDNIAVGTGPLPPVVGQTTSFRIYWSVANSLHDVTNAKVTANLPSGVMWSNKKMTSLGSVAYDASARTVTWDIGNIKANKNFSDVNAWFDVSVTPTKAQVKKILILTDQTTLTAIDSSTNSNVSKDGGSITSNLEGDTVGGGKGLVIDITE